jgi:Spy/CpxP family protein refolding chaperone
MKRQTKIKTSLLALAAIAIVSFAVNEAYSQGWGRGGCWNSGPGYGPRYGRGHGPGYHGYGFGRMDAMKAELGLTDKQVEQIFKIGTEYRNKYFENRNNFDKITELRTEHRKAIENVLTKEQKEKFNRYGYGYGRYGWLGGCPYR